MAKNASHFIQGHTEREASMFKKKIDPVIRKT